MSVLGHNRSSSSLDRGRVQSLSNGSPSASRSHSPAPAVRKKASSNRVPFPRAASESPNPSANGHSSGRERLESRVHHVRPRQQHKRWNSELYMDLPLASGRDKEPIMPLRSRHDSIQPEEMYTGRHTPQPDLGEARRREMSNAATRQKLVIREPGQKHVTYQLGENIGRGQFGSVYRALNLNSGRVVAVKRIKLEDRSESEIRQLTHEVDVLRSLSHPSVVKYEGFLRTDHYFNIVMEYVENGSLLHTIRAFGNLPEGLAANYTFKILEGLHYLHSKKVVHCDLKAANILTTKNGNIKLSDFGVSLNMNAVQKTSNQADAAGTPNWMAPEIIQLCGSSPKSDIWSLACTIIELISGRPPYGEMQPLSAMFRIVEDPYPPLPECSIELRDFLISCFAKDPDDRPSAEQLCHHPWVARNWDGSSRMTLNPQDSIPFSRRISSEVKNFQLIDLQEFAASTDNLVGSSPHPTGLLASVDTDTTLEPIPSIPIPRLEATAPSPPLDFPFSKHLAAMRAVSGPPTDLLSQSAPQFGVVRFLYSLGGLVVIMTI
ncbi:Pkinase-domain-containing protein [Atractiella rhizophila]|nr:Pkinase-domain-containing protein [Atractiella rhizophila]